jgi:hypothetical protein
MERYVREDEGGKGEDEEDHYVWAVAEFALDGFDARHVAS